MKGIVSRPAISLEALKERLGPADVDQIRLLLRVSPGRRILNLIEMQETILQGWQMRLRRTHPMLNDLELSLMVFERLKQNG